MSKMLSLRTFRLTGDSPCTVSVKANEPTHIPPSLHKAALAAGMVFCDDAEASVKKVFESEPEKTELTRDQLETLVKKAFADICEANVSTDFSASGVPTSGAVFRATGQKVPQKDLNAMYAEFKIPEEG